MMGCRRQPGLGRMCGTGSECSGRAQGSVTGAAESAAQARRLAACAAATRPRAVAAFRMFQTIYSRPNPKLPDLLVSPRKSAKNQPDPGPPAEVLPAPSEPGRQDRDRVCLHKKPGRAGERRRVGHVDEQEDEAPRRPRPVWNGEKATTRNPGYWPAGHEPPEPAALSPSLDALSSGIKRGPSLLAGPGPSPASGLPTLESRSISSCKRPNPPYGPLGWEHSCVFLVSCCMPSRRDGDRRRPPIRRRIDSEC